MKFACNEWDDFAAPSSYECFEEVEGVTGETALRDECANRSIRFSRGTAGLEKNL